MLLTVLRLTQQILILRNIKKDSQRRNDRWRLGNREFAGLKYDYSNDDLYSILLEIAQEYKKRLFFCNNRERLFYDDYSNERAFKNSKLKE